ncbi:MAG: hypothetical protein K6G50_10525 [bacterium]|nr:hypothetical protein [bacterium]
MLHQDSITIEYKNTPGEILTYSSTVNSTQSMKEGDHPAQESSSVMTMVMEQKTIAVKGELIDLEMIIPEGEIKRGQDTMPLPNAGQKIGITMKKNGDIVKTTLASPFSQPKFPSKSLKAGDSWDLKNQMEIPIGENGQKKSLVLNYRYTLTGFERVKGYEAAVIDVICPEVTTQIDDEIKQSISASGKTYFAHREGRLISSSVTTHTDIVAPGASITTDITVDIELTDAKSPSFGTASVSGGEEQFLIGI